MNKKKWTIYGAIAAAMVLTSFALADEPSYEDLQSELNLKLGANDIFA